MNDSQNDKGGTFLHFFKFRWSQEIEGKDSNSQNVRKSSLSHLQQGFGLVRSEKLKKENIGI